VSLWRVDRGGGTYEPPKERRLITLSASTRGQMPVGHVMGELAVAFSLLGQ